MQDVPLLERIDWCFTSELWTLAYPNTMAIPLARTTSNHVPIVIKIGTSIPKSKIFRFENFWLQHPQFKEVVKNIWEQQVSETDSAKSISAKFKRLRKGLKIWSKSCSNLKLSIYNCTEVILMYDHIEEWRQLSVEEHNSRFILIKHLESLLHMQKIYWKQRATIRNIKFGEANTKFFQAKATIKHRSNHISMLKDENGIEDQDQYTKEAILFKAFKDRLGTTQSTDNPLFWNL